MYSMDASPPTPQGISLSPSRFKTNFALFLLILLTCTLMYLFRKDWIPFLRTSHPQESSEAAKIWVHYGTLQHHVGELFRG